MTILGSITKYSPSDIRPYVESIEQCGYEGKKVMLVYDVPQATIDYLKSKGWDLYKGRLNQHIILQRFKDIYKLLENFDHEIIIWTDVKDVVFQKDPTKWIGDNFDYDKKIMSFSECIKLGDEVWAQTNSGTTFPMEWEWTQHNTSYCAGMIVGYADYLRDLFLEIYHWSLKTANPNQLADQAAYNILIHLRHFENIVQFVEQEEGFATQMGIVYIKRNECKDLLLEPPPTVDENGWVYNYNGELFCAIHQYDRDTDLAFKIKERYK